MEQESFEQSHIKKLSVEQIENAFSKALEELTGVKCNVAIKDIDFESHEKAWLYGTTLLKIVVTKHTE